MQNKSCVVALLKLISHHLAAAEAGRAQIQNQPGLHCDTLKRERNEGIPTLLQAVLGKWLLTSYKSLTS